MVDVNLLPEELRDKERNEKKALAKKPRVLEIKMSNPPDEEAVKVKKSSLVSRIFQKPKGKTPSRPRPAMESASAAPAAWERPARIKLHIPDSANKFQGAKIDLLRGQDLSWEEPKSAAEPVKKPAGTPPPPPPVPGFKRPVVAKEIPPRPTARPLPPVIKITQKRLGFWQWLKSLFRLFSFSHKTAKPKSDLPKEFIKTPAAPVIIKETESFRTADKPAPPLPPAPETKKTVFSVPEIIVPPAPLEKITPPIIKMAHKRLGFWQWLKSLFGFLSFRRKIAKPKREELKEINNKLTESTRTADKPPAPAPLPPLPEAKKTVFSVPEIIVPPAPIEKIMPPEPAPKPMISKVSPPPPPPVPLKSAFNRPVFTKGETRGERPVRTLEINLIPDELAKHPQLLLAKKLIILGVSILASILVIVLVDRLIYWYKLSVGNEIKLTEQRIQVLNQKIGSFEKVRLNSLELRQRLSRVEDLLVKHIYWTKVFEALQKYTIDDVYFTSFAATEKGDLVLSAVGRNYESVARQLVAFQNAPDFISKVAINSASASFDAATDEITQVNFNVNLVLIPDVYFTKFEYVR